MRIGLDLTLKLLKVPFMKGAQLKPPTRAVSLLLATLIFGLGLASVYPDLHEAFHHKAPCENSCHGHRQESESGDDGHICGVTLLQTGAILHIDLPALDVVASQKSSPAALSGHSPAQVSFLLPPSRAPPIAGIV